MKKVTILIAEDNNLNYFILSKMLAPLDVGILWAKNGREAVNFCNEHQQDIGLVLMDIKMPVMDGYQATREIRKLNKEIPIVAQTAHALEYDKNTALAAGCNDYLTKPIPRDKLLKVVKKYLNP